MTDPAPDPALPVVIVRHPKEKRSKCSVEPLRERTDLDFEVRFVAWPTTRDEALGGIAPQRYVRLDPAGPPLGPDDAARGLLLVDGTWRHARTMSAAFAEVPARSLPGAWVTAYPRTSKLFEDPEDGLATVEALHAALRILKRPGADRVLDDYRWRDAWRAANAERLGAFPSA